MKEEVAANSMGDSSPQNPNSAIAMPEKFLGKGKKLREILKRKVSV